MPLPARRSWAVVAFLGAVLACPVAAGARHTRGLCATVTSVDGSPYLAVLSAFPAELAPLVAATAVETTVEMDGRPYHVGRLGGVRVVLGLTGIGILNAERRTASLLASFPVEGIVMSGVAGTSQRIGDVVVARDWMERDREAIHRVNPALLALARRAATVPLERCTPVPPTTPGAPIVCMPHAPMVFVGGHGVSGDDFGGRAFPCIPNGGDIFGCDLPVPLLGGMPFGAAAPVASAEGAAPPDVEDMESAAVARVAGEARVPFLAVRAASDGAGDPLGDRGFPTQFFDYYDLAARNAGAVTRAMVEDLGALAADRQRARRVCRLLARHRWRQAAALLRPRVPRAYAAGAVP